jgi:hypothetical protein
MANKKVILRMLKVLENLGPGYWRIGFVLSLRVTGYALRVMHCSV